MEIKNFNIPVFCLIICLQCQIGIAQHVLADSTKTVLEELSPFIDSFAFNKMEEYHIPGAAISIVADSAIQYYNGYGLADIENKRPVNRDKTSFRIASITKTFTALAALQLVQKGKLDLYSDIRNFLPDENFSFLSETPITLHHLLTHTAGFDLTDTGDASLTPEDTYSIEEMARSRMPDRVHKPGQVCSYSNFGYTLIGYLIQHVSGQPYEEYIIEHILSPLDMINTSIHQPMPDSLKSNLSKSYVWKDGQIELKRDYTNTLPGGGIISTARDMSNYMLMHLNGGKFKGRELLDSVHHQMLTSQQYGSRKTKYGICYSFFENFWTGRRSIEHSGGQLGFLSLMILIPETGTGLFIAHNNRKNANRYRYDIARQLLDTLVGNRSTAVAPLVPSANFDDIADNYIGTFKRLDYPTNTFEKATRLFGQFSTEYKIEYVGNGRITTYGDDYVMTEEHLFQRDTTNSTYKLEFLVDENGKAQKLLIGTSSYERISWLEKKRVQQPFLFVSGVFLILLFLSRPVAWIIRKFRNKKKVILHETRILNNWLYWTGSSLALGVIGFILHFAIYRDQLSDYGVPMSMKLVFVVCTFGFILTFLSPYFLWQNWKIKSTGIAKKLINTILILSCITLSTIYYVYNIIGFQYY